MPTSNSCKSVTVSPTYTSCLGFFEGNDNNLLDFTFLGSKLESDTSWSNEFASIVDNTVLFHDPSFNQDNFVLSFKAGNEYALFNWDTFSGQSISFEHTKDISHIQLGYYDPLPVSEPLPDYMGFSFLMIFFLVKNLIF